MMYASKLEIDHTQQKIRYHREVELPDELLALEDISKHLKEGEKFGFSQPEGSSTTCMNIYGYRLESEEEVKVRVAKAQKYNENYEKFHKYRK